MEDEFYAIIKLVSGEEIMALVSVDNEDDDPILIVQKPVIMHVHNHGPHSFIKVKPWMELDEEDLFIIKPDKILTMTETHNKRIIDVYYKFTSGQQEPEAEKLFRETGQVRPDSKMGYISSVQEARKRLEEIFNNKTKES